MPQRGVINPFTGRRRPSWSPKQISYQQNRRRTAWLQSTALLTTLLAVVFCMSYSFHKSLASRALAHDQNQQDASGSSNEDVFQLSSKYQEIQHHQQQLLLAEEQYSGDDGEHPLDHHHHHHHHKKSLDNWDNDDDDSSKESALHHNTVVTPQSDLSLPGRQIHVVTTAALPWFTGTAVNPLLRAANLHRRTQAINSSNHHHHHNNSTEDDNNNNESSSTTTTLLPPPTRRRWVTLVVPWLEDPADQEVVYGSNSVFASQAAQEDYIRSWLRDQAEMPDVACPDTGLQIAFYPGRYHEGYQSIFAMGDLIDVMIDDAEANNNNEEENDGSRDNNKNNKKKLDVCVLEEPEHLNWYRAPDDGWRKRCNYVVGIVHTSK